MALPVRQPLDDEQVAHKIQITRHADGVIVYRPNDSNQIVFIGGKVFDENPELSEILGESISVVANPQLQPRARPYPIDIAGQNMTTVRTITPGINVHILFREDELTSEQVERAITIYGPDATRGTLDFISTRKRQVDAARLDGLIASIESMLGDLSETVREQQLILDSIDGIEVDDVLKQGDVEGKVVSIDSETNMVTIETESPFDPEESVTLDDGSNVGIEEAIECPTVVEMITMICDNLTNVDGMQDMTAKLAVLAGKLHKLESVIGDDSCMKFRAAKKKLVQMVAV